MLTLKLEDKVIELNTHDVEGQSLYRVQDLSKGYGFTGKKLSNSVSNWKRDSKLLQNGVVTESQAGQGFGVMLQNEVSLFKVIKGNKSTGDVQGTYVSKELLFDYAMYLSKDFHYAVLHAFNLLTEGKVQEAAAVADSVAISQELIDKIKQRYTQINEAITEKFPTAKSYTYSNIHRLVCKAATGYTPAELTDSNGSGIDYIVHKVASLCAANAYLASQETVLLGLNIKLDYDQLATMLSVQTGKNKDLLLKD